MSEAKDSPSSSAIAHNRQVLMKGMCIRDEFMCPITCELMREPVVASDGHTYEKSAIEKWLKTNHTSPRNGELLESSVLLPNMNLKKLIQDIINEGGAGFYVNDINNRDRLVEVCPEKVLVLECLGPAESEWNQQSFQVNRLGCIGGRRHNTEDHTKEVILFKDITVSRKHFAITHSVDPVSMDAVYSIRDLGSAGGTFIRILFGSRKDLQIGMIILIGKHQFTVSSIDDAGGSGDEMDEAPVHARRNSITRRSLYSVNNQSGMLRRSGLNSDVLKSLVKNAEMIIEDISKESSSSSNEDRLQKDELSSRLKSLAVELSCHLGIEEVANKFGDMKMMNNVEAKTPAVDESDEKHDSSLSVSPSKAHLSLSAEDMEKKHELADIAEEKMDCTLGNNNKSNRNASDSKGDCADDDAMSLTEKVHHKSSTRRLTLTCCAPDGSPLQGKSFVVGYDGASIGRKATNSIPLLTRVTEANGEEKLCSVDTSISSEHARIEYDARSGQFFVCDGTGSKASTNGTWFRLSGPHQESPPHVLKSGSEVLIGTVRFQVKESMTISERRISEEK